MTFGAYSSMQTQAPYNALREDVLTRITRTNVLQADRWCLERDAFREHPSTDLNFVVPVSCTLFSEHGLKRT